jgi:hypothetical protein
VSVSDDELEYSQAGKAGHGGGSDDSDGFDDEEAAASYQGPSPLAALAAEALAAGRGASDSQVRGGRLCA